MNDLDRRAERFIALVAQIACNSERIVKAMEDSAEQQDVKNALWAIHHDVKWLIQKELKMSQVVDGLVQEVSLLKAGVASAIGLLDKLFALYQEAGTDPAAIAAVTADLAGQRNEIAAALVRDAVPAPVPSGFTVGLAAMGDGSVSKSPDKDRYESGESVQLSAEAGSGSSFSGWSGDFTSSDNPASFSVPGNASIVATFVAIP